MSRAIRRNRVMGVGALPILAGLLLASGMLRLGDGTVALLLESLSDSHKAHAAAPGDVLPEDDVAELLSALEARQAELDERAQTLEAESSKVTEGREALRAQLARDRRLPRPNCANFSRWPTAPRRRICRDSPRSTRR